MIVAFPFVASVENFDSNRSQRRDFFVPALKEHPPLVQAASRR